MTEKKNRDGWSGDILPCGKCSACQIGFPDDCSQVAGEVDVALDRSPPAGSWAATARFMAEGDDSGFDWDAWKDEMKERY